MLQDFFIIFATCTKKGKALSLLFFDFGSGEIFLIVLVIFLVFGPDKIPEMARTFGKFINEIKRASEDIKNEINKEADKKEREKKLLEYKEKLKKEMNNTSSQPRSSSTSYNEEASSGKENNEHPEEGNVGKKNTGGKENDKTTGQ